MHLGVPVAERHRKFWDLCLASNDWPELKFVVPCLLPSIGCGSFTNSCGCRRHPTTFCAIPARDSILATPQRNVWSSGQAGYFLNIAAKSIQVTGEWGDRDEVISNVLRLLIWRPLGNVRRSDIHTECTNSSATPQPPPRTQMNSMGSGVGVGRKCAARIARVFLSWSFCAHSEGPPARIFEADSQRSLLTRPMARAHSASRRPILVCLSCRCVSMLFPSPVPWCGA